MSIHQTLVGLELRFGKRASVLSRQISDDNNIDPDESSWLRLGADFPMSAVRVYNRAPSEVQIPTDFVEDMIQTPLQNAINSDTDITRDVSIGAMYTDDLPISGHSYSNIFIVVSFELQIDIPLPRDAYVNVEMYFGWNASDSTMQIATTWYHKVNVRNVGFVRKNAVRRRVERVLRGGAGDQIRDGLALVFNRTGVNNWYVIPGDGSLVGSDSDILIRREASFFVVT